MNAQEQQIELTDAEIEAAIDAIEWDVGGHLEERSPYADCIGHADELGELPY